MSDGCLDIRVAGRTLFHWMSVIIFPLVFIGGGLLGIQSLINDHRRGEASLSWQKLSAVIDTERMNEYAQRPRPIRAVAYRYSYAGREYSSTRVSFDSSVSRREGAAEVARYKDRGTITIFVNPDDPAMAVIEPGRRSINVATLVFSILGIASGLTAGGLLLRKDESEESRRRRKSGREEDAAKPKRSRKPKRR